MQNLLHDIIEVTDLESDTLVNERLADGWILLETYIESRESCVSDYVQQSCRYILGRPSKVKPIIEGKR